MLLRNAEASPHAPFAVMLADLDEVRRFCEVSDDEARALVRPQAPILLLRRRDAYRQARATCKIAAGSGRRWRRAIRGWASCSPTRRCTLF